jgi:Protein of unknown function (DUF1566)
MSKKAVTGLILGIVIIIITFAWKITSVKKELPAGNTLPATGQMESYAEYDDGYYRSGSELRFRDNGDGTITDLNTDLMWCKSGYAQNDVNPPVAYQSEGRWRRYFWNQALLYCDRLRLGGYDDWRLPNYKELTSILDLSRMEPCVDQEYFPGTRADFYWTSSTFIYLTSQAWYVYFNLGYVNHINKNNYFYVRPVRGIELPAGSPVHE